MHTEGSIHSGSGLVFETNGGRGEGGTITPGPNNTK